MVAEFADLSDAIPLSAKLVAVADVYDALRCRARRDLPPPDRGSGIEPQTGSEEIVASDGGSIAFL